ncbi:MULTISPECIES: hypothetical protein [unclassified Micromonospora]|uniref:hypothetical protein n=1 Tax=unclassified Micromonospora TaxID=2617518 RepID=UPI0036298D27
MAETRSTILGVLGCWAGLVVDERRVVAPARTAIGLANFLLRHLRWLAAHPAAGEFSDETARLVRSARRAAYPSQVRQVVLGVCVEPGCDGQLTALLRPGDPTRTEIRCRKDAGHRWADHQWLELSRRMGDGTAVPARRIAGGRDAVPGVRWLAAADIARLWRVPSGTVYRLASEQGWERRRRAGRTLYLETDVSRTFDRRTAAPTRLAHQPVDELP